MFFEFWFSWLRGYGEAMIGFRKHKIWYFALTRVFRNTENTQIHKIPDRLPLGRRFEVKFFEGQIWKFSFFIIERISKSQGSPCGSFSKSTKIRWFWNKLARRARWIFDVGGVINFTKFWKMIRFPLLGHRNSLQQWIHNKKDLMNVISIESRDSWFLWREICRMDRQERYTSPEASARALGSNSVVWKTLMGVILNMNRPGLIPTILGSRISGPHAVNKFRNFETQIVFKRASGRRNNRLDLKEHNFLYRLMFPPLRLDKIGRTCVST